MIFNDNEDFSGVNFDIEITGTTSCTQYDQVSVTGTVTLTDAVLNLSGSHVPTIGETFELIDNDGANDPIVGTFAGLAEGATVIFNDVALEVSYIGGDGNDVVLTFIAITCTADDLTFPEMVMAEGIYHAGATISSQSTIQNSTTVIYKAGTAITLGVGFHAEAGSNFKAMIEACPVALVASEARNNQNNIDKFIQILPKVKAFPNPIRSYTNISINLPEEQDVQLAIYDLSGRSITTILPNTLMSAGTHLFEWSCDQVVAGIYFIGMNGQQVGRLVIID